MAVRLDDPDVALRFLRRDPIRRAHAIHSLTDDTHPREVYVDDTRAPHGVLLVGREEGTSLSMAVDEPATAPRLLEVLEAGSDVFFFALPRELDAVVRARLEVTEEEWAHYFVLRREDFRPHPTEHRVRPLHPEEAAHLNPPSYLREGGHDYMRKRIEAGPAFCVEVDGEIAAWDLTHFETDEVVLLGMLETREKYRRQGYAKAVTTAMVEEVFRRGKTPACWVYTWNDASIRLTEAFGFRRVAEHGWVGGRWKGRGEE